MKANTLIAEPTGFAALGEDELALVLEFASARDIEALTVAARVVAKHVVPNTPSLWRATFCRQWEALNFPLPGVADGSAVLVLDPRVHQLFSDDETESRKFQVLAHAIARVPSFADVASTRHAALYSEPQHRIKVLEQQQQRQGHRRRGARPTAFAFDGDVLGHNRTVRANAPFPTKFRVAVFASITCPPELQGKLRRSYERYYTVGVVSSGYFEVDISTREHDHLVINRIQGDNVVAVGLVSDRFPLVGRQPGWRGRSYGYHGDDGRLFHKSGEVGGEPFGPRFAAGDTVGCGVRIDKRKDRSTVFFTKNGSVVNERLTQHDCVERTEHEWFPAIGLDTYDAVRVNFGQEPFKFAAAVDLLLAESEGSTALVWKDLVWHGISDGSEEEAVYRQAQEAGWKEDEEPMMSFILRMLERRAVLLGSEGAYAW